MYRRPKTICPKWKRTRNYDEAGPQICNRHWNWIRQRHIHSMYITWREAGLQKMMTSLPACTNNLQKIKDRLKTTYYNKINKIWVSHLNTANKCKATNALGISVVSYTFGWIKWKVNELQAMNRQTRKIMTKHRSLHPNASIHRIYLPRKAREQGLLSVKDLYNRVVISVTRKIDNTQDPLLQFVKNHEDAGIGTHLHGAASLNLWTNNDHTKKIQEP